MDDELFRGVLCIIATRIGFMCFILARLPARFRAQVLAI